MRLNPFVPTIIVIATIWVRAASLHAAPPDVVHVPDESIDAALATFGHLSMDCGCDDITCLGGCETRARHLVDYSCAPWTLLPELAGGITITGWLEAGGAASADQTASRSLSPLTFADRQDITVNQLYAIIERSIDTTGGWDIGGRIDVLFGTDARFTEVPGLELERDGLASKWNSHTDYRLSTPQAYAEVGVRDWSVKLGHWYANTGYETVMAPQNFFYTHAYTMAYGEPFTFTGALLTYELNERVSVRGAVHGGWNSFDATRERAGFLGGVNWTSMDERTSVALTLTTGDQVNNVNAYSQRSLYSIVLSQRLNDDLTYVFQHDNGWQQDDGGPGVDAEWYGINQYLIYTLNACWSMGARLEWFRDDEGVRVPDWAGNTGTPGNYWEATFGMNWTPGTNLTIRPELRWDWFDGVGNPYNDGQSNNQCTASFDAILTF